MIPPCPVDEVVVDLVKLLSVEPIVILQAPPGSGKTTRIPLHLLHQPQFAGSRIVMMEPRRLAAANAARWMAGLLGEPVGETVGYAIRFHRRVSDRTRLEIVTEGILTRRLQHDAELAGTGLVIFDEFHERNLQADLALALCRDSQGGLRPDLRILIMSATLDAGSLSQRLQGAPVVQSSGRTFPVDIRYVPPLSTLTPVQATAEAVTRALAETTGDILAFLPGSAEIRAVSALLQSRSGGASPPFIHHLYGDLPFAEQERAIMPAEGRKVVLATNIAETSLTIENVRVVVDSGWHRKVQFDPRTGLERYTTARVSQASADQRAGRAGRQAPGICYRLWSHHVHQGLLPATPPEILVSDLSQLLLETLCWGVRDPGRLQWVDPPPAPALAEAGRLLCLLGGVDDDGRVTARGRAMADTGLHPRLARLLVEAKALGRGGLGCDLAALLGERDIVATGANRRSVRSDSDLLDRLELLRTQREGGLQRSTTSHNPTALAAVERVAGELRRRYRFAPESTLPSIDEVSLLCAVAWPDRIAVRRAEGEGYLLPGGLGARLGRRTALGEVAALVAIELETGKGPEALINLATAITLAEVRRLFADSITRVRLVYWDREAGRVSARLEERLGAIVLSSAPLRPEPSEARDALLGAIRAGEAGDDLPWSPTARQLLARLRFLQRSDPEGRWPDFSPAGLLESLHIWLAPRLTGASSLADVRRLDLGDALRTLLDRDQLRRLNQGAPETIQVPSGHRVTLEYPGEGPPVLAVKLQEMFGCADTPRVAFGRVPVLLHLLSPARRPIQVTQDLRSFWDRVYPEVKKEMKGRYPRHPWPDDPWSAPATRSTTKRLKG